METRICVGGRKFANGIYFREKQWKGNYISVKFCLFIILYPKSPFTWKLPITPLHSLL